MSHFSCAEFSRGFTGSVDICGTYFLWSLRPNCVCLCDTWRFSFHTNENGNITSTVQHSFTVNTPAAWKPTWNSRWSREGHERLDEKEALLVKIQGHQGFTSTVLVQDCQTWLPHSIEAHIRLGEASGLGLRSALKLKVENPHSRALWKWPSMICALLVCLLPFRGDSPHVYVVMIPRGDASCRSRVFNHWSQCHSSLERISFFTVSAETFISSNCISASSLLRKADLLMPPNGAITLLSNSCITRIFWPWIFCFLTSSSCQGGLIIVTINDLMKWCGIPMCFIDILSFPVSEGGAF